jgi:hypothetical protein
VNVCNWGTDSALYTFAPRDAGVYGALEEAGVAPTSYTLCDLFTALSRCPYLEITEVDAAFAVMAAFRQRSRAPPAAEVYTALLSLCVKVGHAQVEEERGDCWVRNRKN